MGHLQSRPGRWSLFINQPCMCVCSLSENMLCYFPPSRRAGQMGPPSRPLCIYTAQILLVLDVEITVSGSDGRTSGQTAAFSADSHNVMCAADSEVPYSSPRVAYPPPARRDPPPPPQCSPLNVSSLWVLGRCSLKSLGLRVKGKAMSV